MVKEAGKAAHLDSFCVCYVCCADALFFSKLAFLCRGKTEEAPRPDVNEEAPSAAESDGFTTVTKGKKKL